MDGFIITAFAFFLICGIFFYRGYNRCVKEVNAEINRYNM